MEIKFVDIQNFRRLKECRIDFSEKETVFVGANNSGKTSAMDALIKFFKTKKLSTRDFTLSNWIEINKIGNTWIKTKKIEDVDLSIDNWDSFLPSLDVWLSVNKGEVHHVSHLIPTLDWDGGLLGVRLRFEPDNMEELFKEFSSVLKNTKTLTNGLKKSGKLNLWPKDLWDFLDKDRGRYLNKFFSIKAYLLNPKLVNTFQKIDPANMPLEKDAFSGLIKIDIINAQRGFSDADSENSEGASNIRNLSSQLRGYYDKHLNPNVNPSENDLDALKAIQEAKEIFDKNLQQSFKSSINELEILNYPGFDNPKIELSSKFDTVETLNHDSSVRYNLSDKEGGLSLPEKYNGLGYQNLISMVFKLIRFRDEWMQVGKSSKENNPETEKEGFEPLHLVLIEEPEAHLHAQVQQVFVSKAYEVLRNHSDLKDNKNLQTQLIISTHSNHIAHALDFTSLRYFKRLQEKKDKVNTSKIVNLSEVFGDGTETTRFAKRYLRTTHCDLFFADAVILVEGPAERMLVPYFIKHHSNLSSSYISILEIGGSHAHRLKPLIEKLGVITLIITDIDSIDPSNNRTKVQPEKKKGYETGNDTLRKWIPSLTKLDEVLELDEKKKVNKKNPIRVAYQIPITLKNGKVNMEVSPYTFEDSLVLENEDIFKKIAKSKGLLKKMVDASKNGDKMEAAKDMFKAINEKNAKKAEFALELFFFEEPNTLKAPKYIKEGLEWVEGILLKSRNELSK